MPTLSWSGAAGEAIASHVPAFVRVSYAAPGESPSWDLLAVMDGLAVAVLRCRQRALVVAGAPPRGAGGLIMDPGFGWSFYGFFAAAAAWLVGYFLWAFRAAARDRRSSRP